MEIAGIARSPLTRPIVLYAAWVAMFFYLFAQSWVSEDAYITFRVIDNFIHGYGLRWNIYERVQVDTHPLWMLLHLPFAFFWPNLFELNIALSLLCSSAAVGIVLLTFRRDLTTTLAAFMLPLFLSKTFIEYAGSGLETSLSYLLFSMLGYVVVRWQERPCFLFAVMLVSSLLLLNRLDHILLIAPLLAMLALKHEDRIKTPRGLLSLAAGVLPLLCWFSFSLFYYGFLFPNTKYAKLDTGWHLSDYLAQGLQYSFTWLTQDTASVVVTLNAIFFAFWSKQKTAIALALGILINLAYVGYIGGDYMMGRFFAVIFFAASWLLLASIPYFRHDKIFVFAIVLFIAFATSYFVRDIRTECEECVPIRGRVMDARSTFRSNSLFTSYWPPAIRDQGQYKFRYDAEKLVKEEPGEVKIQMYVGMLGYYAGPTVAIIDELGLCDAFLARLPARTDRPFYVGHYKRRVPRGYPEAVKTGKLDTMDTNLARYYDRLRLITQGDLWDKERLMTILRFNLGLYDEYKFAFLHPPR